jgi:hypothetical protein
MPISVCCRPGGPIAGIVAVPTMWRRSGRVALLLTTTVPPTFSCS